MADSLNEALEFQLPFWDKLSKEQRELLSLRARPVSFEAGDRVHGGDTDCLGVLLVLSGILRTYLLSEDGKEATIYRLKRGDTCMLTASCILEAVTFEVHIDAEEHSEAILVPTDVFSALSKENIYVENFSNKMVAERISDIVSAMERILFMSLEQRLAAFLIDEMSQSGSNVVHLTHEHIARSIGSAREAVSRILKQMSTSGSVELFRGGVRVVNKSALYNLTTE